MPDRYSSTFWAIYEDECFKHETGIFRGYALVRCRAIHVDQKTGATTFIAQAKDKTYTVTGPSEDFGEVIKSGTDCETGS